MGSTEMEVANVSGGPRDPDRMSALQTICNVVNTKISKTFEGVGRTIARHPYLVIVLSVVFAAIWGTVYFQFAEEDKELESLYTPFSAESVKDREYFLSMYGEPSQPVNIMVTRNVDLEHENSCKNRSLVRNSTDSKNILLDLMSLYELIESQKIEYEGQHFSLEDVCSKPDGKAGNCEMQSILDVWKYNRSAIESDENVLETIGKAFTSGTPLSKTGVPIIPILIAGKGKPGSVCENRVEALQLSFSLENEKVDIGLEKYDPESRAWTAKLVETVNEKWYNRNNLVGHVISFDSIATEAYKAIARDLSKFSTGYIFVFLFAVWVLFRNSPVVCKSHLAPVSILAIVMAVLTAFGIAVAAGVKLNFVTRGLPFILLGLGIDDTFVIMGAYHSTNKDRSVEDRIAETMAKAGSSILVTSVSDMIVFLVGTYTDLPVMRAFSIYAFLGIIFDFLYQVTFFMAFVVLDARREKRAMHEKGTCGLSCCGVAGGTNSEPAVQETKVQDDVEKGAPELNAKSTAAGYKWRRKLVGRGDYDPDAPTTTRRIVGEWLPDITLNPCGSIAILLVEALLLAAAVYGCTNVKMDFRYREWFVPKDSYLSESLYVDELYFLGQQDPFFVMTKEAVDGRDFYSLQDEYLNLVDAVRNADYVANFPPVVCWYEQFSKWLSEESPFKDQLDTYTQRAPNATAFYEWLHAYLDDPAGKAFKNDVIFGKDGIKSTRFTAFTESIKDGDFAVTAVQNIRDTTAAAASVLDPSAYAMTFLFYDGFKVITGETVRNILMAGAAVFVVLAVVLANIQMAFIVTVMITLTDVMLFGFLWYAGLTLNMITSICMVVSIGLAVDYSAHIAHSFMVLNGSRRDRARGALLHIGGEVCDGAFTTWLAIAVMCMAEHYISQVFFKMFFAIVITGVWHGIVILPVVLSLIGPADLPSKNDPDPPSTKKQRSANPKGDLNC